MKKAIIAAALMAASFGTVHAAATIQFSVSFNPGSGMASNLANAAGVVSNGMKWGIIVDTNNNGIQTTYDPVTPAFNATSVLTVGGVASGDVILFAGSNTFDTSQGGVITEGDFGNPGGATPGGNGGIDAITVNAGSGVLGGQSFRVIWFDPSNNTAGTLQSGSFVLPDLGSGGTFDLSAVFLGTDPIRSATGITFQIIPEPTTAILGAIGALGLLRRRR